MLQKSRILSASTKKQVLSAQQDDAWLNDAVSLPQPAKTVERVTEKSVTYPHVQIQRQVSQDKSASDEQETITSCLSATIVPGHQLWAVVLHLSECIRQELLLKSGISGAAEKVQIEYVQKRTLEILRGEPKIAQQVRDLSEGKQLLQSVLDEVCGYGPLTPLMQDDNIAEITVVGPRFAYVERNGMMEDVPCTFEDDRHMQRIIENMLRKAGRHMRNDWPIVDVRLPDGSLVNIVMPPSAVNGPTITIRKGSTKPLSIENLLQLGTLSQEMAEFLRASIQARRNIVICGGVNSGRTTLLNALSAAIPADERIVTIEGVAELRLSQRHVVGMVAQLTSPGGVTMIRNQIATAIGVIVYIARLRDGTRKILNIAEVQGVENDAIQWQSIFYYPRT